MWTELCIFRIGIDMTSQLTIINIIFGMDSSDVVNIVNSNSMHSSKSNLFFKRRSLFSTALVGELQFIIHVYREANRCINLLVNFGHSSLNFNWNFLFSLLLWNFYRKTMQEGLVCLVLFSNLIPFLVKKKHGFQF
jgi:hypothetical protein